MIVTLKVLVDVYSKPDKKGITKLIKKDKEFLKQFETSNILAEQLISARGVTSNKHCFVKDGDTYFKLNHKFDEIRKLLEPIKIKGFR